jgi:hypothetical protein
MSFLSDTNILSTHLRCPAGLAHRFFRIRAPSPATQSRASWALPAWPTASSVFGPPVHNDCRLG